MLLEGAGFSVQDELQCLRDAKSTISALLPGFFDPSDLPQPGEREPTEPNLDLLKFVSRSIKSEIGLWIRRQVGLHVVQGVPYVSPSNKTSTVPPLSYANQASESGQTIGET
jgi:hypothetical protein